MHAPEVKDLLSVPSTKHYLSIDCGYWRDGMPVQIPVVVVTGAQSGPLYCATAGIHGDEVAGTVAIQRVAHGLDPAAMSGSFLGVLAANIPAFRRSSRVDDTEVPAGRNDMAALIRRAERNGSLTERIACFVRDDVVALSDYYVDVHTAQDGNSRVPTAIIASESLDIPANVHASNVSLAIASDFEYVYRPVFNGPAPLPTFPFDETKPSIELEVGPPHTAEGADLLVTSITNLLTDAGILEGQVSRTNTLTYIRKLSARRVDAGGLWEPIAEIGQAVNEGELLGVIRDLQDQVREEVRAPATGIVLRAATSATIMTGMMAYGIGIPSD